jgi:RNA polymerase sigma factor (sigma-70 family)
VDFAQQYLDHRALIERTIAALGRRHRLAPEDLDEFSSAVHLHFIEDDYAALRAFQGRCQLSTYVHAVVRQRLQIWRNTHWGRWRPSAVARRLGPVAMLLEQLTGRDDRSLEEAIEVLRLNHGVADTPETLRALADKLPTRARPRFVSTDTLPGSDLADDRAATAVLAHEVAGDDARLTSALDDVLSSVPELDQLILRLRFEQDLPMPAIGRIVGINGRLLYGRLDRLLQRLREALEGRGVTSADAQSVLGDHGFVVFDGPLSRGEGV